MKCQSCGFEGAPNLEETGPHTKATCRHCGKYIKMVSKEELVALIEQYRKPKLQVWTAQYRYQGDDRIDITTKSARYPWSVFAPTWDMVMEYKRTLDEGVYIDAYKDIIDKAFKMHTKALTDLLRSDRTITLVCFCPADTFCHRVLLARYFALFGAVYHGERRL